MALMSSIVQTLQGSGIVFETFFADLLSLFVLSYVVIAVVAPKLKRAIAYSKMTKIIGGPKRHWLYGHSIEYGPTHQGMVNCIKRCKEFPVMCMHYFISFKFHVQIYHPDVAKQVLTRSHPKSWFYDTFFSALVKDGLITSTGKIWKRHRKLLTPVFHFAVLKEHCHVFNVNCKQILKEIGAFADEGKSFDVTVLVGDLAYTNMIECVMSQESQDSSKQSYIDAVKIANELTMQRLADPLKWITPIYLYLTSSGRRFRKTRDTIHSKSAKIIKERRKLLQLLSNQEDNTYRNVITDPVTGKTFTFQKRKGKPVDFLDILLQTKDDDGCGMTDDEIFDEVVTFFAAGQETTATATNWTMYLLSVNEECQAKCRDEILRVFGNREECEYSDLSKLVYLTQCIKESMRLYPSIHMIGRSISEDLVISHPQCNFKEVTVPKGTNVTVNIIALHRNPDVWENPEVFDPERFNSENSSKIPSFAYLPFSAGPRNCIGQNFAMTEMKVLLSHLLRRFEFRYDRSYPAPSMLPGITLLAKDGIHLLAKRFKPYGDKSQPVA